MQKYSNHFSYLLGLLLLFYSQPAVVAHPDHALVSTDNQSQCTDGTVIVFDVLGGRKPRMNDEPRISIYCDGRIILGNSSGLGKRIESQINQQELDRLISHIIKQNNFLEIDSENIRTRIIEKQRISGQKPVVADAGEIMVRLTLADRQHEVRFYALDNAADRYPSIPQLKQLHAIVQELKKTITWIRVGGETGLLAELMLANNYLSQQYPDIKPLGPHDLSSVDDFSDGRHVVRFVRRATNSEGEYRGEIQVTVHHTPEKTPTISVNILKND